MTIDEKLENFRKFCLEDAGSRAARIISDYRDAQEKIFEEYKLHTKQKSDFRIKAASDKIKKEFNIRLSLSELELKRVLGKKKEELRDRLIEELEKKVEDFRKTSKYLPLLESQVESVLKFADGEDVLIYIDPADLQFKESLLKKFKGEIHIAETFFGGGIQALIPGRNILIDHSFRKKLSELKDEFYFGLGEVNNG